MSHDPMMKSQFTMPAVLAAGLALCLAFAGCSAGEEASPGTAQTASGGSNGGGPVAVIDDPLFSQQWHLENTGQGGGTAGEDARVVGAWSQDISGRGVRIAVVDDGLEIAHEDLIPNIIPGQSHNYLTNGSDPTPTTTGTCREAGGSADCHGTAVAGVAAERIAVHLVVAAAGALGVLAAGGAAILWWVNGSRSNASRSDAPSRSDGTSRWGEPDAGRTHGRS